MDNPNQKSECCIDSCSYGKCHTGQHGATSLTCSSLCDCKCHAEKADIIAKEICETIDATSPTIRAASPDGTRTMTGNPSPTVATSEKECKHKFAGTAQFVMCINCGLQPYSTPNESEDWEAEFDKEFGSCQDYDPETFKDFIRKVYQRGREEGYEQGKNYGKDL